MLIQWLFDVKRKEFYKKKSAYLQAADEAKKYGEIDKAAQITRSINILQESADQLSLHYANGGNCFSKGTLWKVNSFWSKLNELDDSLKPIWKQILETIIFVGGTVFFVKRFWFANYVVPSESAEPNLLIGDRIIGIKYPYLFKDPERGDLVIFDDVFFKYSKNPLLKLYQQYIGFGLGPLPAGPESWTKRVVGLPGDKIKLSVNQAGRGEIYVNDELLPEPNRNPYPIITLSRKSGILKNTPLFSIPAIGGIFKSILGENENLKKMHSYTFDPDRPFNDQPFYNIDETEIVENPWTKKPLIFWPDKANPKKDSKPEFIVPEGQIFLVGDNRHGSYDGRSWGPVPISLIRGRVSFIWFSIDGTENWLIIEFLKNPITFFTKKMRWGRILRSLHPFTKIPTS